MDVRCPRCGRGMDLHQRHSCETITAEARDAIESGTYDEFLRKENARLRRRLAELE